MNPLVIFSLAARIRMTERFAPTLASHMDKPDSHFVELEQRLKQAFPNAEVVLVQHLYEGFRRRAGEFVLLAEVTDQGETSPVVVKLTTASPAQEVSSGTSKAPDNTETNRLQKELNAWQSCRPSGLKHDLVLMNLEPVRDASGNLIALVYADAEQLIGVDQTLSLEDALQDFIRLGEPTAESVADVLFQLYERLGLLLYRHSFEDHVGKKATRLQRIGWLDRHLQENLDAWENSSGDSFRWRSGIITELDSIELHYKYRYRDPVELLRYLINESTPTDIIPCMLRGRSHGDLHGRNVLVGKVGRRILWPAVFDYGDMSRKNLIAWDFVKLETELKIRVYPLLFSTLRMAQTVVRFEEQLNELTELARERGNWPERPLSDTPEARLQWLLLQIRRLAMRHLKQQGRIRRWLMEYYFALSLYGLNSIRFENLEPTEMRCALLSSGCAAARFYPLQTV